MVVIGFQRQYIPPHAIFRSMERNIKSVQQLMVKSCRHQPIKINKVFKVGKQPNKKTLLYDLGD